MKSPQKQAVDNTRRASSINMKFGNFLQGLPQADNRFSDADWPHTETVHLAPVGGRRASPYNVWIHWLPKEEPDQFAKRGKADFKPQISLQTAQRTMKTFKLGYQAPMKDACASSLLRHVPRSISGSALKNVNTYPPPPTHIFLKRGGGGGHARGHQGTPGTHTRYSPQHLLHCHDTSTCRSISGRKRVPC